MCCLLFSLLAVSCVSKTSFILLQNENIKTVQENKQLRTQIAEMNKQLAEKADSRIIALEKNIGQMEKTIAYYKSLNDPL
ncbi:MAG: hypothetical protein A2096_04525 [Spirochaetes bacterium GWF1_41_5]|nr:MAG: hypothetical protein A2096_04525 [Spirochaetes bacterium GWF1_41_5]HBE03569.1 hypothetical protein [Spirochaetia bacterium]